MARFWKKIQRNYRRNINGVQTSFYRGHAKLGKTLGKTDYRIPDEHMSVYDNKPVLKEQQKQSEATNEIIKDIALSMAELGFEVGFKNKAMGKAARTGFSRYRYYRDAARRSRVYRKTNSGRSSGSKKYGNGNRTSTYRRN
jgi:hypothetical protein